MQGEREIIRPSARQDIERLGMLFEEVFGERRDPDVWRWKYFDNPRGTFSFVCESDGRIVAHCGGTPLLMRDGGSEYLALQSVDFMSTRKYAGGLGRGGVFFRMVDGFFASYCGEGGAKMVYGFPGERHRLAGERILRYAPVELVGEFRVEPVASRGLEVEPLEPFLALLSQANVVFGGVRDATYLDWRYLRHPIHRYEALVLRRWPWRKPALVAILRETESETLVLELEGDYSDKNLQELRLRLERGGKPTRMWGSLEHGRGKVLARAGFRGETRPHWLETRFFMERPHPAPGELYYSLGDYDVY